MIVSRIDPEARSTLASAKGFRALTEGDTELARQKYGEAGAILVAGAAKTTALPEKNLLRFLAASQYYRGGEYQKAYRLTQKIRGKYLSEFDREKFREFCRTLAPRVAEGYAAQMRRVVLTRYKQDRFEDALKILQDHPYIYNRASLAVVRGKLCVSTRRWHAAAIFFSDAIRFSDADPNVLFMCAGGGLQLLHQGHNDDDAWQYMEHLLKYAPNALTLIVSCALRLNRLASHDRSGADQLVAIFQQARAEYQQLPERVRTHPEVRDFLAYGFVVATAALERSGDREAALQLCQEALTVVPSSGFKPIIQEVISHLQKVNASSGNRTTEIVWRLREEFQPRQEEVTLRSIAA